LKKSEEEEGIKGDIFERERKVVLYTRRAPPARIPARVTAQIANP
jgi:hypothetical protein